MTLTETSANAPSPKVPTTGRSGTIPGKWLRKNAKWVALAVLFAALVTFLVVQRQAPTADSRPLSANNPGPEGAMALAELLGQHGVRVTSTDSLATTLDAVEDNPESTVLVYDPRGFLGREQLTELRDSDAAKVVAVSPRLGSVRGLDAQIQASGVVPDSSGVLAPSCRQADATAAGNVAAKGTFYTGPVTCYTTKAGGPGLYAASATGKVVVLGSKDLLNNAHLAEEGHAALSLRTLGTTGHVVWYLPGVADLEADASTPTLNDLAPPWLAVGGPWLALVAVLAIAWRGRRLGPLVHEPLPVVVKAAETAEGRARLYQDSRAVQRAADNIRAGTLWRLARHFNLGAEATPEAVVEALERRFGRPVPELRFTLLDAEPQTEGHLVQWAQHMERIEREATAQ
ncbi:DUF4350 domain-containing protein [Paenarthrobacter sp. NPDC089714]|uniref:DUF4350 domain-containing protein n=1 Tax=Paenarthrobacter sp. NPDC089714 TaxID=3364377 RepID=UPI0037FAB03E